MLKMNTAIGEPVANVVDVDRLAVLDVEEAASGEAIGKLSLEDWNQVCVLVHQALRKLKDRVQQLRMDVHCQPGQASANYLFAYWTFEIPSDHAVNPIIVGVDFDPEDGGGKILIQGSITVEETGQILFETLNRQADNSLAAVLAAAHEVADELAARTEIVIESLEQPRFQANETNER